MVHIVDGKDLLEAHRSALACNHGGRHWPAAFINIYIQWIKNMRENINAKTVTLDTPIKRGKTEIKEIVLRKPQSGALRGVRLQALMKWTSTR